jgi:K+-transporting ATPase KdpF subunit
MRGDCDGFRFHRHDRWIFRLVGGIDPILFEPDGQGRPLMNWVYWLSGAAALVIFVYLIVALFKPEVFE